MPALSPPVRRAPALLALAVSVILGLTTALGSPSHADPADPDPSAPGSGLAGSGASEGQGQNGHQADLTRYKAGRYLVMLAKPGATTAPATRARKGQRFNPHSSSVANYERTLRSNHDALGTKLGFDVDRHFTVAANGFVADLSSKQATDLATDRDVLVVQKDAIVHADASSNTAKYLKMTGKKGTWAGVGGLDKAGDGVVVGVIDSGIWPESDSFVGDKLTAAAKGRWKLKMNGRITSMTKADGGAFRGECQTGEEFELSDCTSKIISARYYVDGYTQARTIEEDYLSPRDGDGHGSHTASTAAGAVVTGVQTEGVKFGTMVGMAPAAKIAVYKALWEMAPGTAGATTADIGSAIEDAVSDGVDVLNYSISGSTDTTLEAAELAFEGAAEAGIFVAASAGNEGPGASTVAHNSPWLTTVAANTYTSFENTVVLGDGQKLVGASITKTKMPATPLVDAADSGNGSTTVDDTALCAPNSLDPAKVTDKIVVCQRGTYDRVAKSDEVKRAGGVAMVLANITEGSLDADFHAVPTVHISDKTAPKLYEYLDAAGAGATASFVLGNTTGKTTPVPQIAGFSSRGPAASDESDLLKPDVSAPGVSVLAAVAPPSNSGRDYDLYSGTSMSAPHIAGLAAVILGDRPKWSAMHVKSAMMTTATSLKTDKGLTSKDLFAEGAGQVNPSQFFKPGLFVLSDWEQWQGYLADQGVDTGVDPVAANAVNLPSLAEGHVMSKVRMVRTFTAQRAGTWKVSVKVPGFSTATSTSTVKAKAGQSVPVKFAFTRTTAPLSEWAFGYVTLTGPTTVRLPVALRPVSVKAPASVTGQGVEASVQVPVTGGFSGGLNVSTAGLVKGDVREDSVAAGQSNLECLTVGEDSDLAQFDLVAPDAASDLDMYIYAADSCDTNSITGVVAEVATPSAGETYSLRGAEAGTYIVEVNPFQAGDQGDPVPYSLRMYDLGGTPSVGDLTLTPNPVPVRIAKSTSFDAAWTGLDSQAHYLGVLGYDGAPNPTYLYVDTDTDAG
ncbi:MAG: S8 family peptidase [Nocardioidaceae bacterium]|nr:S8 family peptidase [Nocardioidaceae bacterium]